MLNCASVAAGPVVILMGVFWLKTSVADLNRKDYRHALSAGFASLIHISLGSVAIAIGIAAMRAGL